jgi:hypothetical protein
MSQLNEIKRKRFQALNYIYEKTGGNEYKLFETRQLADLGLTGPEIENILQYLEGENLIKDEAQGEIVTITHWGVVQVEKALSNPEKPTQYFPPVNIITIHSMVNSQIQQGTHHSNQTGAFSSESHHELNEFINLFKQSLTELQLKPDDHAEVQSEVATIEAQLASSRPKSGIIKESLKTLRNVLEGATGSLLATELLQKIAELLR